MSNFSLAGIEITSILLKGKWKFRILKRLYKRQSRFGNLRRDVGEISEKVLIQQLKELIGFGLVERIDFDTAPPHVEYRITELGQSLIDASRPLCEWGQDYRKKLKSDDGRSK